MSRARLVAAAFQLVLPPSRSLTYRYHSLCYNTPPPTTDRLFSRQTPKVHRFPPRKPKIPFKHCIPANLLFLNCWNYSSISCRTKLEENLICKGPWKEFSGWQWEWGAVAWLFKQAPSPSLSLVNTIAP